MAACAHGVSGNVVAFGCEEELGGRCPLYAASDGLAWAALVHVYSELSVIEDAERLARAAAPDARQRRVTLALFPPHSPASVESSVGVGRAWVGLREGTLEFWRAIL